LDASERLSAGAKFVDISQGHLYGGAVGSDGTVYVWGTNYYGCLGISSTTNSDTTRQIQINTNLQNAVDIDFGYGISMAVIQNGSQFDIVVWGVVRSGDPFGDESYNNDGSSDTYTATPCVVQSFNQRPRQIAASVSDMLLLDAAGNVWSLGTNTYDRHALGSTAVTTQPTQSVNFPPSVEWTSGSKTSDYGAHFVINGELYISGNFIYSLAGTSRATTGNYNTYTHTGSPENIDFAAPILVNDNFGDNSIFYAFE
jgi:alpha-tubulin suppressor-like RCC1 family protein